MAWGWIEAVGDAAGHVPDVAWAAVVTGMFLTGQQILNNRREARRRDEDVTERQTERDHAAAQAEKEREHATAQAERERDHAGAQAAKEREHAAARAERERAHQRQMLVDSHNTELARQRAADERAQRSQLIRDKMDAYQAFLTATNKAERQINNKTRFGWHRPGQPLPRMEVLSLQEITDLQMLATRVIFLSPNAPDVPKYKSKIEASAESMLEAIQTIATVYELQTDPPSNSDFIRTWFGILGTSREEYVAGVREELAELFGRDPQALPREPRR